MWAHPETPALAAFFICLFSPYLKIIPGCTAKPSSMVDKDFCNWRINHQALRRMTLVWKSFPRSVHMDSHNKQAAHNANCADFTHRCSRFSDSFEQRDESNFLLANNSTLFLQKGQHSLSSVRHWILGYKASWDHQWIIITYPKVLTCLPFNMKLQKQGDSKMSFHLGKVLLYSKHFQRPTWSMCGLLDILLSPIPQTWSTFAHLSQYLVGIIIYLCDYCLVITMR